MAELWKWSFVGYESPLEGRPVQAWYNGLDSDARYEISDLLNTLANVTHSLWRRPEFDPLKGAGGISEIRVPDIRNVSGSITYRIYGFFGPRNREYCLLHGTDKVVKNDKEGKSTALRRFHDLQQRRASVHKFAF
jgi:hypothetical protein